MRGYDSFLVTTSLGANRKIRRLTPAERWCAVHGVWAIAAESPVRGYLFIAAEQPAVEKDYAELAGVTLAVAKSTVRKMRELGMLEHDPEMGVEHVHDWGEHQPEPKPSDTPEAWRERKRRSRERHQAAGIPKGVSTSVTSRGKSRDDPGASRRNHAPKEEGEEEGLPPLVPPRGKRQRDRGIYDAKWMAWARREFPDLNPKAVIGHGRQAVGFERITAPDALRAYILERAA